MWGGGGVAASQPMSTAVHRSPNKVCRSNSIFNLYGWTLHLWTVFRTAQPTWGAVLWTRSCLTASRHPIKWVTPYPLSYAVPFDLRHILCATLYDHYAAPRPPSIQISVHNFCGSGLGFFSGIQNTWSLSQKRLKSLKKKLSDSMLDC
jgi:hypothetical protein